MNSTKTAKNTGLTEDDFIVRKSTIPKAGKGLFAKTKIRRGEHIGFYEGKVLTDKEVEFEEYGDSLYLLWICKDHWVFGEGKYGNYTQYINHSRKPNVELVTSTRWKTARFRALSNIKEGEELFFDYGDYYWEQMGMDPREI